MGESNEIPSETIHERTRKEYFDGLQSSIDLLRSDKTQAEKDKAAFDEAVKNLPELVTRLVAAETEGGDAVSIFIETCERDGKIGELKDQIEDLSRNDKRMPKGYRGYLSFVNELLKRE